MSDHRFSRRMRRTITRTTNRFRRVDRSDGFERRAGQVGHVAGDELLSSTHVLRGLR